MKLENICNLNYLTETMGGKKNLINEIMEVFLIQIPEELSCINEAIKQNDFAGIKKFAHTMKSSVSIMGITALTPVLQEMEDLGTKEQNIERIVTLNEKLNLFCNQAIEEINTEKVNYIC